MNQSDADEQGGLQGKPLYRLGVTGGIGSGKSVICDGLRDCGLTVISTDHLARQAVAPGMPAFEKIVRHFGQSVVSGDGDLDRKALRRRITDDPESRAALESIVHPEVFAGLSSAYASARKRGESVVAVEVPLLFETGIAPWFDCVLTVTAAPEVRIRRVMARDRVSRQEAAALLSTQMPEDEKRTRSDFVIENNGTLEDARNKAASFYKELLKRMERLDPEM